MLFISQLPKEKRFALYKAIKRLLLAEGVFSYRNISNAMDNKVKDLPYEVQIVLSL